MLKTDVNYRTYQKGLKNHNFMINIDENEKGRRKGKGEQEKRKYYLYILLKFIIF